MELPLLCFYGWVTRVKRDSRKPWVKMGGSYLGYQLPFLIGTESGLLQEVTEHYIALPKGYYTAFAFKKRSRVLRPTWTYSRLRTVACASLSIMPLIKARNDGVVINSFILLLKCVSFVRP